MNKKVAGEKQIGGGKYPPPQLITGLSCIFTLVKQYLFNMETYIRSMNDELYDDINKFMLSLMIELQDHK